HAVARLTSGDRNQLEARAADRHLRLASDQDVGPEALEVLPGKSLAEEARGEGRRRGERARELLAVVLARVELHVRAAASEERVAADVIPVRVSDEDRRQCG